MGVINSVNGNLNAAKNNNDVNIEVTDIEDIEDKKDNVSYVNKNNTDVEDFDVYGNDITSLTPEQIESLVGTMTPEEYEEFVAGIEKYYDNQIEYANTVIYGKGGYKELYDELSDKLLFIEEDYLHQVQIYYNELHQLWENTDSLKNSGITYEEFEKMTSDEQAKFVRDKSDEASDKIKKIQDFKADYDKSVRNEYPDLGVKTFDDLIKVKNQLGQTIEQTDEDIEMLKNKKESAKYDYIYFTKDYKDYEFKTEFTEADIATLEFCKNGSEYDYDAYHEKYPNISITEFYMMVYEDDSNGKVYTSENTSVYVDKVAKLSKVNPSLAKTYQYIYEKDPNEAYDFINDCEDEINKCQGMLDAQDFLDKYMLDEEGGIDAICNELNITREGLMDGLDTFVDGIYYSGEAIATLFGFSEENRVKSADEYKKMYLLYSLMSKEDKIKYGLITYDEDGNLVNTNPNSVIDFTKSYDGLMLDANYQLSQGIGNIAPSIAINYVLPGAGNVTMGVSAGGNAYHISMVEGNGVLDSIGYGIFTGTSEAISEKVLGGIQGLSDVEIKSFKDFLASMGKEGIQESYQEIMDVVYRCTFMGEKLPESPEEWEELIHQVGVAGTYGMVTAGVLNSSSLMARVNLSGKNDVNTNTDINNTTDVNIDNTEDIENSTTKIEEVGTLTEESENILNKYNNNEIGPSDLLQYVQNGIDTNTLSDAEIGKIYEELVGKKISDWAIDNSSRKSLTIELLTAATNANLTAEDLKLCSDLMIEMEHYYADASKLDLDTGTGMFNTYRSHGIVHIVDVLSQTLNANTMMEGLGCDVNKKSAILAAIMHDTGMSGGVQLVLSVDKNGNMVINTVDIQSDGGTYRESHSFNSGVNILNEYEILRSYGFTDAEIAEAALIAFGHSKSNSGLNPLTDTANWSFAIQALDAATADSDFDFLGALKDAGILNSTDITTEKGTVTAKCPDLYKVDDDGHIIKDANGDKIVVQKNGEIKGNVNKYDFNVKAIDRLAAEGLSVRIGDAWTNNDNAKVNQYLGRITIDDNTNYNNQYNTDQVIAELEKSGFIKKSETVDAKNIINNIMGKKDGLQNAGFAETKHETSDTSVTYKIKGVETNNSQPFVLGENNLDFNTKMKVEGNTAILSIDVKNANNVPYCTLFAIDERVGELTSKGENFITKTAEGITEGKKLCLEIYIDPDTDAEIVDLYEQYEKYQEKKNGANIEFVIKYKDK